MRMTDTTGDAGRSGAVPEQLGFDLLPADAHSTIGPATRPTTRSSRTSTTVIRTTTTWTTSIWSAPSAESYRQDAHVDFPLELLIRLDQAWRRCKRTKANTPPALRFEMDRERHLLRLRDALLDGSYKPEPSRRFAVTEPKVREIWAKAYPDRVVEWVVYLAICAPFHRRFIHDSFACIPGRGTMRAAERLEHHARSCTRNWTRPAHYLKFDISNFFVSIHKPTLQGLLASRITDPWWREVTRKLITHDPREGHIIRGNPELLDLVPMHKRLTSQDADHGLPIGNLLSQFSANVYLDVLDQFMKHVLKIKHSCRYVDDVVAIHESPQQLNEWLERIQILLRDKLQLELNPTKTVLQPARRGIDFVGQVIGPHGREIRRRTFNRAVQRIAQVDQAELMATGNSYFGMLRQCSKSFNHRRQLSRALLERGQIVNGALTKTYRRSTCKP